MENLLAASSNIQPLRDLGGTRIGARAGVQRDSEPGMGAAASSAVKGQNLHGWCLFGSTMSKLGAGPRGMEILGEGQVRLPIHPCR